MESSMHWAGMFRTTFEDAWRHRRYSSCLGLLRSVMPSLSRGKKTICGVFCARNDDYVPDNRTRLIETIAWNCPLLCDEAVFVEWNTPDDVPLLAVDLAKQFPNLRSYVVGPEIHDALTENPRIPFMEYFAKNAGIRRAKADYICITNSDTPWSPSVQAFRRLLRPNLIFRTRRRDYDWDGKAVTSDSLNDEKLWRAPPWAKVSEKEFYDTQTPDYGSGDFVMAHRDLWMRATGFDESIRTGNFGCDGRGLRQLLAVGGSVVYGGTSYHMYHANSSTAFGGNARGDAFDYQKGLPYKNPDNWGLADCVETEIAERVWRLRRA